MRLLCWGLTLVLAAGMGNFATAAESELAPALAKLRAVGPKGAGHEEATVAWKTVATSKPGELTAVLAAFDGANPLAENWLRAAVEAIADQNADKLPLADLEAFLKETKHSPRARRVAYELILSKEPAAKERLLPGFVNDPSLELRRDAVEKAIATAEAQLTADKKLGIAAYRVAFDAARDLDQVKATSEKLKSLEQPVDLPGHYGFLMQWQLVAPFDNREGKGFDVAYPPEAGVFDADATFAGVGGDIGWMEFTTTDDYGAVDLNKALDKHKGAIGYAYTEFKSDKAQTVQFRLGCINANKLWVNGELVFANHVYHAGQNVDQYIGTAKLKPGKNTILLKIAQNEQTEPWAQDWTFQLRVCDEVGTAILATDRAANKTASAK